MAKLVVKGGGVVAARPVASTATVEALAEMDAAVAEVREISGLTGEDEAVANLVSDPETDTASALSATIDDVTISPDAVGYDIILVEGQSNGLGRGVGIDLDYLDLADSRVHQFANLSSAYPDQVVAAREPLFHQELPASTVGFVLSFAKRYALTTHPNRRVLIVPCCHGDTGFAATGLTWRVGVSGVGVTNLHDLAVAQVTKALALPGQNRVVAALWHQGEANTGSTASSYRTDLLALLDDLRTRYGSTLPFVIGQMSPNRIAAVAGYATIDGVHQDMKNQRPHVGFWAAQPMYNSAADVVHFSAEGQRYNGVAAFNAYKAALTSGGGNVTKIGLALPPAATAPTVIASDASASLSWPKTLRAYHYVTRYRTTAGPGAWSAGPTTADDGSLTTVITSLTNGTGYDFQVAAVNDTGQGDWSPTATGTPASAAPGFLDTFTVARTLPGYAEDGKLWTRYGSGTNTGTMTVAGGVAKYNGEVSTSYFVVNALSANGTLEATIGAIGAAAGGMCGRVTDANTLIRVNLRQSAGTNRLQLMKYVGGVSTLLGTSSSVQLSADGSVVQLIMNSDNTVSVKLNGTTVIAAVTIPTSDVPAVNNHGLYTSSGDLVLSFDRIQFTAA